MPIQKEHPLASVQAMAAFAVAALFWTLGVSLIDPRAEVGVLLCAIGTAATIWLFWSQLTAIPKSNFRSWPWLGMVLLIIEVSIPAYLLYAKPVEEDLRVSFHFEAGGGR
jgi:hypothetical protein